MIKLDDRPRLRPWILVSPSERGSLRPETFGAKRDMIRALRTIFAAENYLDISPHMIKRYLTVGSPFKDEDFEIVKKH